MTNQKDSSSKASRLTRYMKAPLRLLSKARDFYVKGMTECSGHFDQMDGAVGGPAGRLSTLPRSFSVTSSGYSSASDDDLRDLVRASSVTSQGFFSRKQPSAAATVPRSRTVVGIERIDEDKVSEFDDDFKFKPRSRSHGVQRRETGV